MNGVDYSEIYGGKVLGIPWSANRIFEGCASTLLQPITAEDAWAHPLGCYAISMSAG
jgi:hypothetical protein